MKYQAKIDLSNKNNSHTLAYDFIKQVAHGKTLKILEVGASSGYFGSVLKEAGHQVWGVEPTQEAANIAASILDFVFVGFIQDFLSAHSDQRFDVIVFGDVLEHLANPVEILKICATFLNDNGHVVASVPNVAHIVVRAMLLEGRWEYSSLGILDETHLRFFTKSSLIRLFTASNYVIHKLHSTKLSEEQVNNTFNMKVSPDSLKVVKDYAKDNRLLDFQYVLIARPAIKTENAQQLNSNIDNESLPRVVCLLTDLDSTIAELRTRLPLESWALKHRGNIRFIKIYDHTSADLSWGDIFVFQRVANEDSVKFINYLRNSGKRVVFEIDDLLTELPDFLSHHFHYIKPNIPFIHSTLRNADAVTVTTTRLANEMKIYNNNVYIVPNCSEPLPNKRATHSDAPPNEVSLLIASSDKVLVDFIAPALKIIQDQYGVKIFVIGPPGESLQSLGIIVNKLDNLSYQKFKEYLVNLKNCIGLIPLDDSRFSSSKSPIKYFDYSVAGIPSICSNVPPYSDCVEDGITGYLVNNTTDEWVAAIKKIVLSSQIRLKISAAAEDFVSNNFNFDRAADAWETVLSNLARNLNKSERDVFINNYPYRSTLRLSPSFFRQLFMLSSYIKAVKVIRTYGFKELLNRIRQI